LQEKAPAEKEQSYEKGSHDITDPSKPEALKTSLFLSPERKILDGKRKRMENIKTCQQNGRG